MPGRSSVTPRWASLGLLLVGGVVLAGCGTPVGRVTGKVTHKDQPVAGAELVFQSEAKKDEQFFGNAGDDGTYQVSYRTYNGLPVGRYQVTVRHYTLPNGKPLPPGEAGAALKSDEKAVERVYVFTKEIVTGTNAVDFELTKGKKSAGQ